MGRSTTPAFILRTVDYGDYHVIAHLLGRDTGRLSAIAYGAKSSKRRFGGALQPLRVVEATYSDGKADLYRLDELDVIEDFPGLDERIETITAASYATELVRETWREGTDAEAIFELMRRFFLRLCDCESGLEIARLVHQFEYWLLGRLGVAPTIHHCSRCGLAPESMDKLRFGRRGEGLICGGCRHRNEAVGVVTPETLRFLHHLADPDVEPPTEKLEAAVSQAGRVMANAVEQVVEKRLSSREMFGDLV